jgi:integrase
MSRLRRRQLLALRLRGRHFALHMRRTLLPLRLGRGGRHERQGGGEQAIRGVMTWYADQDEEFRLPLTRSMRVDKRTASERARAHYLNDDEIRALWKACDNVGTFGVLVKVLLLTGQRLRKVAHMQWDDIDANRVWTIAEISKREKGHAGKVTLPNMVFDLINSLPRIAGNPHVFPAAYGTGPISAFGVFKQVIDKHLPSNMRPWRLYDLRRTALAWRKSTFPITLPSARLVIS